MITDRPSFISRTFLRSVWAQDYDLYTRVQDEECLRILRAWTGREARGEVRDGGALVSIIFNGLWDYQDTGVRPDGVSSVDQQRRIPGAGPSGRPGAVDAALGWFGRADVPPVVQVACEFKDLDTDLDAPQNSRADARSPVEQALNYLAAARRGMSGLEDVRPTWAIVTDSNAFRLYWNDRAPGQYLAFNIEQRNLLQGPGMLGGDEAARFERFLFMRVFHSETLLTASGRPLLERLISQAWVRSREIEKIFYAEYRAYRTHLFTTLLEANADFPGTRGRLVRLAQKLLDRSIFIFYCEDMGRAIGFPPQLLRDFLISRSNDAFFDPKGTEIWSGLRRLFDAMNDGAAFGGHQLNQFNGGLFRRDADLDGLVVPNLLFCCRGQGHDEATLYGNKLTLLYFSAAYNYAADLRQDLVREENQAPAGSARAAADARKSDPDTALGLYTLGHIFEQSITELEIIEADAEGRVSVNREGKRKTDGVYYTPEWVVERIVHETLGERLSDIKAECGWTRDAFGNLTAIAQAPIDAYLVRLRTVRILDPACGSGAFLITALRYLLTEWRGVLDLRRRVTGDIMTVEEDDVIRDVLRDNLYGVDINPASVEITQLALWLHTARADRPLSSLDPHIRDGNSLIDNRYWHGQIALDLGLEERERVNSFDWDEAFPEVAAAGGFDVVIGNPPYVKLQNFRKAHPAMADYIRSGRPDSGFDGYASAESGSFDLYMPFIEMGLDRLMPDGRMGYIAPSLWTVNDHGAGLRRIVAERRPLSRWLDFRSHQVFEEATVYTALQFFRRNADGTEPQSVQIASAPDGVVSDRPWEGQDANLAYDRLEFADRWLMLAGEERELIDQLVARMPSLDDPRITSSIFVGLQTSADDIYHLLRIGPGLFRTRADDRPIRIEDALMHPLVSGTGSVRHALPSPDTYILFPYEMIGGRARLIDPHRMANEFGDAWGYLGQHERELRDREGGSFDDDEWYRFGRNQSLDRQHLVKIMVPRLVPHLRASVDYDGTRYIDNVDVCGITTAAGVDPFFLAGVLNGPVADFVFRRISKPFRGGYLSANRQFIAPLPIPAVGQAKRDAIARVARDLQVLHTNRGRVMRDLAHRIARSPHVTRPLSFIFPDLASVQQRRASAPRGSKPSAWAKSNHDADLASRYMAIERLLRPGVDLVAAHEAGELSLSAGGTVIIDGIFIDDVEGAYIAAQWNGLLDGGLPTSSRPARSLVNGLRKLVAGDNAALRAQIIELEAEARRLRSLIDEQEGAMNSLLFTAYGLTPRQRRLVEQDRARR